MQKMKDKSMLIGRFLKISLLEWHWLDNEKAWKEEKSFIFQHLHKHYPSSCILNKGPGIYTGGDVAFSAEDASRSLCCSKVSSCIFSC